MKFPVFLFLWLALALPASAETPSPVLSLREVTVPQDAGRVPVAGQGAWRDHVQLVWSPSAKTLSRRSYRIFDPFAEDGFDLFWQPRDPATDKAGPLTGEGILTWRRKGSFRQSEDGIAAQFIGHMQDGRATGFGRFTDASGLRYTGLWRGGLMHGAGQLQTALGDALVGTFQDGLPAGQGRLVDVTGATYAGPFENGAPLLAQSGPTGLAIALSVGGDRDFCCGFRGPDLGYASLSEPGKLSIFPDDPRLMDAWRGRANVVIQDPVEFDWARALEWQYSFLNYHKDLRTTLPLRFGLRNTTTQGAQIIGAYLDIDRSRIDAQPMMQAVVLKPLSPSNTDFSLENYGWSSATDVTLTARFVRGDAETRSFTMSLPDIEDINAFSFIPVLRDFGVATDRLPEVETTCAGQFGQNSNPAGCTDRIRQSGIFGNLAPLLTENEGASSFGVNFKGTLGYGWLDADGGRQRTEAPFEGHIPLAALTSRAECEGGDFEPVNLGQPFDMELAANGYRINMPVFGGVQAGEERRWEVLLDAAKSSNHDMRVVILLADGREVVSRDIAALIFNARRYSADIRPFQPRC